MTPRARLLSLIDAAWTTQAIHAACALRLPDILAGRALEAGRAADEAGADADSVRRLLRSLVTLGLCHEDEAGHFALTAEGALLIEHAPGSLSAWARMSGVRLWRNWAELTESVRSGRSARLRRHGADDFGELRGQEAEVFNAAMAALTAPVAEAAARELDWSGVRLAVDVGGGCGAMLAAILGRHPSMEGIVFDLPHAAASAAAHLGSAGVAGRVRFVAGSFFDPLPAGGDVYLLKSVLHNWDDAAARRILQRCAAALAPGASVRLVERVLPDRLVAGDVHRDLVRSDLNMLVGCGGRERSESEFASLVAAAGMRLREVRPLAGGFSALLASC